MHGNSNRVHHLLFPILFNLFRKQRVLLLFCVSTTERLDYEHEFDCECKFNMSPSRSLSTSLSLVWYNIMTVSLGLSMSLIMGLRSICGWVWVTVSRSSSFCEDERNSSFGFRLSSSLTLCFPMSFSLSVIEFSIPVLLPISVSLLVQVFKCQVHSQFYFHR